MKKAATAAEFKEPTETPSADAANSGVLHPCNAWALSAGYESWQSALEAMHDGKVIRGSKFAVSRPGAKTVTSMQLFIEQVSEKAMHSHATDDGSLIVGLKSSFPTELIAEQEAWVKGLRDELQAMFSPHN